MVSAKRRWRQLVCAALVLTILSVWSIVPLLPPSVAGQAAARQDAASDGGRLRALIERFQADRGSLQRFYTVEASSRRRVRFDEFYRQWLGTLASIDFASLPYSEQVDYLLFRNYLDHELRQLAIRERALGELEPVLPFSGAIVDLEESRRRMEKIDALKIAGTLNQLTKQVESTRRSIEAGLPGASGVRDRRPATVTNGQAVTPAPKAEGILTLGRVQANRAVSEIASLRRTLKSWFDFYNGYDPLFTWWVGEPYKAFDQALQNYSTFLRERVVGIRSTDEGAIVGNPIGREALLSELAYEMIPYTPEELIAIAEKEFAWCEAEMKKAAREMGYGDDWLKAVEHVKNLAVEPGRQTEIVRKLANDAIDYLDKHDLVTVPPLARETWRMEMLSPQQQMLSPFFLGGETIQVSYPTNTMPHEAKLMSMRGNNPHFSSPTVQHELFPGHGLQQFMSARYRPWRSIFATPFWTEGWALYWEFLLWDMKFPTTVEDRVGFLFWRSHRCARIIFSLSFHLEKMTPQECIDLLVRRVGHEVDNATAEVRRSFAGMYGPLYQAAYMLGGLQFYSLHRELVASGKMTNRAFHDAILQENRMPVEMVRAILTRQPLTRDFKTTWRFYQQ